MHPSSSTSITCIAIDGHRLNNEGAVRDSEQNNPTAYIILLTSLHVIRTTARARRDTLGNESDRLRCSEGMPSTLICSSLCGGSPIGEERKLVVQPGDPCRDFRGRPNDGFKIQGPLSGGARTQRAYAGTKSLGSASKVEDGRDVGLRGHHLQSGAVKVESGRWVMRMDDELFIQIEGRVIPARSLQASGATTSKRPSEDLARVVRGGPDRYFNRCFDLEDEVPARGGD
ncbi:hypothetical protein FB451DRAFT_1178656 [Mycena latifolia]|nr:hypothetical protein FB451DRAFT_1178656 [Mycena latifolia]